MKNQLLRFTAALAAFTAALLLLHYFVINSLNGFLFFYSTWAIYTFLSLATFALWLLVLFVYSTFQDKTGFAFLAAAVLKMFAAVVFLLPLIQSGVENPVPDVLNFFIPYFLYLLFETIFAIRLLNGK
jgi:uncharacterized membrane protein YcgQ (UPF0703/DUF1980 family)